MGETEVYRNANYLLHNEVKYVKSIVDLQPHHRISVDSFVVSLVAKFIEVIAAKLSKSDWGPNFEEQLPCEGVVTLHTSRNVV